MKYSEIKALKSFCENLASEPDWKEVLTEIIAGFDDFEIDNVRFIKADCIDKIQQDEMKSDLYCLGCFNSWFISDCIDIDRDVIEAMQKAEAYEAIGKLIISLGKLEEMQEEYARLDGYGHHFNLYDGNEETITVNNVEYYVFDNR